MYNKHIRFLFIQHKNSSSVARITFFKVAELDLLSWWVTKRTAEMLLLKALRSGLGIFGVSSHSSGDFNIVLFGGLNFSECLADLDSGTASSLLFRFFISQTEMMIMTKITVMTPDIIRAVMTLAAGEIERYFMDWFLDRVSAWSFFCCTLESDKEVSFTGLRFKLDMFIEEGIHGHLEMSLGRRGESRFRIELVTQTGPDWIIVKSSWDRSPNVESAKLMVRTFSNIKLISSSTYRFWKLTLLILWNIILSFWLLEKSVSNAIELMVISLHFLNIIVTDDALMLIRSKSNWRLGQYFIWTDSTLIN